MCELMKGGITRWKQISHTGIANMKRGYGILSWKRLVKFDLIIGFRLPELFIQLQEDARHQFDLLHYGLIKHGVTLFYKVAVNSSKCFLYKIFGLFKNVFGLLLFLPNTKYFSAFKKSDL